MKCPIDQTELVMSDRQGVEIDYCPQCRGVWLDSGELDKIIERSASHETYQAPAAPQRGYPDQGGHHQERGHKRGSWLSDIFD